ncbi:hypothetical protein DXG03_001328 [Asterophora parasitica]|uniref:Major facilitator superfamily (MFS) profile domain-containing protein n=1 Tax=Asterophora parasitica TaxID=117018 RepID=A0A9P7G9K4_9AGAR|nr:hypothetical protein DXG03_001328 [Asterophora parasitica]
MAAHSRSRSRSRNPGEGPYVPQPESLIFNDGAVGQEAAEFLEDLVHPHQHTSGEIDVDADYRLRREVHKSLAWWKRPSSWWLLFIVPFTAVAMSATLAPRVEVFTLLACSVHKPDIFRQTLPTLGGRFDVPEITMPLPPIHGNMHQALTLSHFAAQNDTKPLPNLCASDPVVQAAAAKLSTGTLSCITTGWWGSFSDRYGRTRLLGFSVVGLLFTDFNFIFVSRNFQSLPGGYWFLVLGPIIEGSVGGLTAAIAAMHAYIADTTPEAERARTFSLSLGLMFAGMAVGPSLGGLLIHFSGKVLSVFYAAFGVHVIYAFLVWFVLPESLLKSEMQKSKHNYETELRDSALDRERNPAVGALVRVKRLFAFLSPLTVFLPEINPDVQNPLKRKKRDWNLTIVAASYGLIVSVMGSYPFKFQYASLTFGWTSETLGYWLTLVGATRALFLTIILPVIIYLLKPTPVTIELPSPPEGSAPQTSTSTSNSTVAPKPPTKPAHASSFDLKIAHASLIVDAISYTLMAAAPTALVFTACSILAALGGGLGPALQSVALALYRRRGGTESGRLFGALSVISALSSQILGPAWYGLVYMKTVATFPRAIFILSMVTVILSVALLAFVRLPNEGRSATSGSSETDPLLPANNAEDEETRVGS